MTDISNSDDMIDPSDVDERIEELESERSDLVDAVKEASEVYALGPDGETEDAEAVEALREAEADAKDALDEFDRDNGPELKALTDFRDEYSGCDGPLIRESYFEAYAMEVAMDVCDLKTASWPFSCIDWEQAASELQHDYTGADFDGVTYYGR